MDPAPPLLPAPLNQALARLLPPPATPPDLHARVTAAIARDAAPGIDLSRHQLRRHHATSLHQLRRHATLRCLEAVILAACLFPSARLTLHALPRWSADRIADPSSLLATLIPVTLAGLALLAVPVRAKQGQGAPPPMLSKRAPPLG